MVGVDQALERILDSIIVLPSEDVPLLQALGRILAKEVRSGIDVPPFDNSAMDGYAVRSADVRGASDKAPVVLRVLEDLAAGYVAAGKVQEGQAIRIMTGAPMPIGADTVVMVEATEKTDDGVKIFKPAKPGENVRYVGEDIAKGSIALAKGKVVRPGDIGILATLGKQSVSIVKQPNIAILSTGDELVEIEEPLAPGKIRNSNAYALAGQIVEAGGKPIILGIARDRREDLIDKVQSGLNVDMLVTSGGVSVGDYDLVKAVLAELGDIAFMEVAMKPAKSLAFGLIQSKPVFGLPGNPASSMISFERFVRPAILKMGGRTDLFRPRIEVVVDDRIKKKLGRRNFLRVIVEQRNGKVHARLTGAQGSAMLTSMSLSNALLIVPEEIAVVEPGDRLTAEVLYEYL